MVPSPIIPSIANRNPKGKGVDGTGEMVRGGQWLTHLVSLYLTAKGKPTPLLLQTRVFRCTAMEGWYHPCVEAPLDS